MDFNEVFEDLEPGRYFNTVWAALPPEVSKILQDYLDPIKSYLDWYTGSNTTNSKTVPHISLRYLGYESDDLRQKMLVDRQKFTKALNGLLPVPIELGELFLWLGKGNSNQRKGRINWKFSQDPKRLKQIHQALLNVPGYAFYTALEGDNFSPHISVGQVKMQNPKAYQKVDNYIAQNPLGSNTFLLTNFELNSACPDKTKSFRIPLT